MISSVAEQSGLVGCGGRSGKYGMVWYGVVRYGRGEIRPVWPSAIVGKKVTRGAEADQHISEANTTKHCTQIYRTAYPSKGRCKYMSNVKCT